MIVSRTVRYMTFINRTCMLIFTLICTSLSTCYIDDVTSNAVWRQRGLVVRALDLYLEVPGSPARFSRSSCLPLDGFVFGGPLESVVLQDSWHMQDQVFQHL